MYQFERSSTKASNDGDEVGSPVPLVGIGHFGDELLHPRLEPEVERLELSGLAGRPIRHVGVVHEELHGVPERQQPPLDLVRRPVAELEVLPRVLLAELPAHDVCAHAVERLVRLDRVAPRAVHLPPGLVEQLLVGQHPAIRERPEQRHRHERDRVEPEPDLLAHLRDPVGREPLLPVGVVRKISAGQAFGGPGRVSAGDPLRVLPAEGRERDDARVEPGIADLGDPLHVLPAGLCNRSSLRRSRAGGAPAADRARQVARSSSSAREPITFSSPQSQG